MSKLVKYFKKGERYVLQIGENRVILSHPQIVPVNSYRCDSLKDINYFFYDVKIKADKNSDYFALTKKERKAEEKELGKKIRHKWKTIASGFAGDDGSVCELPCAIDEIIKANPDKFDKKHYFLKSESGKSVKSKTDYETSYEISCVGAVTSDFYQIKKVHRHFDFDYDLEKKTSTPTDYTWYEIYIGIGGEPKFNTIGFRCPCLAEEDLLIIKQWAEDFIAFSMDLAKQEIERREESEEIARWMPRWFKDHMKEKYPEDYPNWKEIWVKLNDAEFVLEEYYKYVQGEPIENPVFSGWEDKDKVIPQELIKDGMKDWEAYIKAIEFVENTGTESNKTQ